MRTPRLFVASVIAAVMLSSFVSVARAQPLSEVALRYLNRLSDLLFVLARVENKRAGVPDVEWAGLG